DGRAAIAADCSTRDSVNIRLLVEADFHVGAQRAEFGLGAGVQVEVGAGQPGIGVVVEQGGAAVEHVLMTAEAEEAVGITAADADLNAQIAADLEAGLGARDVIEAGAVNVADADIFSRLRDRKSVV